MYRCPCHPEGISNHNDKGKGVYLIPRSMISKFVELFKITCVYMDIYKVVNNSKGILPNLRYIFLLKEKNH